MIKSTAPTFTCPEQFINLMPTYWTAGTTLTLLHHWLLLSKIVWAVPGICLYYLSGCGLTEPFWCKEFANCQTVCTALAARYLAFGIWHLTLNHSLELAVWKWNTVIATQNFELSMYYAEVRANAAPVHPCHSHSLDWIYPRLVHYTLYACIYMFWHRVLAPACLHFPTNLQGWANH